MRFISRLVLLPCRTYAVVLRDLKELLVFLLHLVQSVPGQILLHNMLIDAFSLQHLASLLHSYQTIDDYRVHEYLSRSVHLHPRFLPLALSSRNLRGLRLSLLTALLAPET